MSERIILSEKVYRNLVERSERAEPYEKALREVEGGCNRYACGCWKVAREALAQAQADSTKE